MQLGDKLQNPVDALPVCFTNREGDKFWYVGNLLHRIDGPAVECATGSKEWYQNGKLHRVDGPAIDWANGAKSWYLNGERLDPIVHFLKVGELELDKS